MYCLRETSPIVYLKRGTQGFIFKNTNITKTYLQKLVYYFNKYFLVITLKRNKKTSISPHLQKRKQKLNLKIKYSNSGNVKPNIPISSGGFLSLNRSHRRINVSVFSVVGHSPCLVIWKHFGFLKKKKLKFQQKVSILKNLNT